LRRWLAVTLGAGCLLGTAIVVTAAAEVTNAASSPIEPSGAWRWILIIAGLLALASYVGGVLLVRAVGAPVAAAATLAAAIQLAPLAGPTLLSTDAWTYWMYGRVAAVLDGNPYSDPPSSYPLDPAFAAMGATWRDTTSLYGPLFTFEAEAVAISAGDDAGRAAWLFRLVAAISLLAATAAAAALARRPSLAIALAGWNPLLAVHFGGGGHNDATMMAFTLLALLLAARGRANLAGLAWSAAILIKWVPIAFLALWLVCRRRAGQPLGIPGLIAGLTILAFAATLHYGSSWLSAVEGLSGQARRTGSIGLSHWLGDLGIGHRGQLVIIGSFLIIRVTILARSAWDRRRPMLGVAGSILALGQGWLNPWYASWGTTLSASEGDRLAHALALGLTAFLMLDALPL